MKYRVINVVEDMKLLREGKLFLIRRGKEEIVSAQEYQFLGQVYGLNVKGDLVVEVRVTEPVKIEEPVETVEEVLEEPEALPVEEEIVEEVVEEAPTKSSRKKK